MCAGRVPWRVHGGRLVVSVRVTAGGGRDALEGLCRADDGAVSVKVRVAARPEKGRANKAVIAVLARALGIARSELSIVSGETGRYKTMAIAGGGDEMCRRIEDVTGAAG